VARAPASGKAAATFRAGDPGFVDPSGHKKAPDDAGALEMLKVQP